MEDFFSWLVALIIVVVLCATWYVSGIADGLAKTKFLFDKDENICYIQIVDDRFNTPCDKKFPFTKATILDVGE